MGRVSFSFLLNLIKNNEQLKSNGVTTLITEKKTKLKIVKNEQFSFAKRNQGKQYFLGILDFLLGSQYDVHFLAEFKSLKDENKRRNYLTSKL